ncbi:MULTISPECIES: hypothetical protein [Sphingobacterium]|uniref:hypothetical protein n=1 Tax=Sphingobacterium TaxID=28453 RepID=UPI0013E4A940|nr:MULTISPECIES: hypothetical protein [Sphingobacterium]QIH31596.1 hypothetical protein G6053_01130 [Sphingobacterium sp. DR205]
MIRSFFTLLVVFVLHTALRAQEKFDPVAWKAPYDLSLDGWGIERFPIPIDFAPKIPYKGVEDVRFTSGWNKPESDEYWSYAFLWYIEGQQVPNSKTIEANLSMYFDGLVNRNIEKRALPKELIKKTKTKFKKLAEPEGEDESTFTGTIQMVDYMGKQPITLHSTVHVRKCPGTDHTIIFHQFSPQERSAPVWSKLDGLWHTFHCSE